MRDSFNKFHWEFYKDEGDSCVYVYETRSGDVIGYLPSFVELETVHKILNDPNCDWDEDDVNYFIEENIEWL